MTLNYPTIKGPGRKSPTGRTLWCGPFAVAMVTGLSYDNAHAKLLADIRRAVMKARRARYERTGIPPRRQDLPTCVKGTYEHQIARTLNKLKVKTTLVYSNGNNPKWPTLLTFSREHTRAGKTYIIVAGHHWITLKDGILYHSHHAPVLVAEAPRYRMAKVECWAEVQPLPAAVLELEPQALAA